MPQRNDIFEINIYHSTRPVWHQIYILNKKAQLMVPNCIFLHLFHISRGTGFLKRKKNHKRKKEKEQTSLLFINRVKVIKAVVAGGCLLRTSSCPVPFLFLSVICSVAASVEKTCTALVKISSFFHSVYPIIQHSAPPPPWCIMCLLSLLPDTYHLPRGRICGIIFNTCICFW